MGQEELGAGKTGSGSEMEVRVFANRTEMKTLGEQVDGPAWGVDEGNRVRTTPSGPGPLLGAKAWNWAPDGICLKRLDLGLPAIRLLRTPSKLAPR